MNLEYLLEFHPVLLALFATLFTWAVTAAGSALVFTFKTINQRILNLMLGFAAGVMIAASFWSLLSFQIGNETDLSSIGVMIGFATRMVLDVGLA